MSIGYDKVLKRLNEERKRNNWSQDFISRKLWITQSHYSKMESGKKRFSYKELQRLSEIGIDIQYIFTGQKERSLKHQYFFQNYKKEDQLWVLEILYIVIGWMCQKNDESNYLQMCKRVEYMRYLLAGRDKSNIWHLLRDYFDYTQKQMAALLCIDVKKYRHLENGDIFPDSEIIFLLCQHFKISPWMAMDDERGQYEEVCKILFSLNESSRDKILKFLKYAYHLFVK